MVTRSQGSGSLPAKPGRLGLSTRHPSASARLLLSLQYIPPPAKYPWRLTAQTGSLPGPSGPWARVLSDVA